MRADRLLSILLLLQTHERLTARELAARLEVSERTIHRDMEALSVAGVPVAAERGAGGGWFLAADYETNLTGLNPPEIQALFLANPEKLLADLGLRQAAEAALIKLLAALPTIYRRDAEFIRQRIYIDTAGWQRHSESAPCLPVLQQAVWQERQVRLVYQRGDAPGVERQVSPLGLVAKGSVWYLVAQADGDIRSYRVSRIQNVTCTDQPVQRPPGFDLAAYWAQSVADFVANLPRYPTRVRIAPEALKWAQVIWRYAKVEAVGEPDADGWVEAEITFEVVEEAYSYLMSAGPLVEVLDPPELRAEIITLLRQAVTRYTTSTLA